MGVSVVVLGVWDGEDDCQHTDGAGDGYDDAGDRAFGDEDEGGEENHDDHHAYGTSLLRGCHAAVAVVVADVFAQPRGQQPLL